MIEHNESDPVSTREILAKSLELQNLSLSEVSSLIYLKDNEMWSEVFEAARKVKEKVYGRRVVLFAPLYLSNMCLNECIYCGFRRGNKKARRKRLSVDEAVEEASLLAGKGYKRLL
ncbi:MAG: [FeFe] hydrogenase H-cluster radical SAM maturase HydG, partial [Candidatus Mariimomonas ferrooxydans]